MALVDYDSVTFDVLVIIPSSPLSLTLCWTLHTALVPERCPFVQSLSMSLQIHSREGVGTLFGAYSSTILMGFHYFGAHRSGRRGLSV